jgi:hypothetical protein
MESDGQTETNGQLESNGHDTDFHDANEFRLERSRQHSAERSTSSVRMLNLARTKRKKKRMSQIAVGSSSTPTLAMRTR